jgi:FAD/FMN-containing dehydrogenase
MAAEYYVNLAKTIIVKVDNKCEPTNELEVIKIIEDYKDYLIRPYGGTHSWAPSVVSDYDAKDGNKRILVMDTSKLKNNKMEIVQIGDDKCLRMGPGETQGSMAEFAVKHGQCFPVTGALQTSIRVGGFLASGCHGKYCTLNVYEERLCIQLIFPSIFYCRYWKLHSSV